MNRLLIPLDGAQPAETALECAAAIAGRARAALSLVSVASPGSNVTGNAGPSQDVAAYLDDVRARFELPVESTSAVRVGDPAGEIIAEARSLPADMIVMPDRSTGERAAGELGRVTSRILLGSPVPVLLVKRELPPTGSARSVIVMLDGSRLAEEALGPGVEIARACDGRLTLATVLTESTDQYGNLPSRWSSSDSDADLATKYLARLARSDALRELDVSIEVTRSGITTFLKPFGELADTIVVLTTRGASGFSRWVLGGVADHVSRAARVTTLVVPPRIT